MTVVKKITYLDRAELEEFVETCGPVTVLENLPTDLKAKLDARAKPTPKPAPVAALPAVSEAALDLPQMNFDKAKESKQTKAKAPSAGDAVGVLDLPTMSFT